MAQSNIEWTDYTWNYVRGCKKISPGCKHCYAEAFAERFRGVKGHAYERGFDPRLAPDQLLSPMEWIQPREVFVNSMSDLFFEEFSPRYIAAGFGVMKVCRRHTFQVLTKRAESMEKFFDNLMIEAEEIGLGPFLRTCLMESAPHISRPEASLIYHELAEFKQDQIPEWSKFWPLPNVHLGVSVEDRKYGLPRIDHLRRVPAAVRWLSIEPLLEDLGELDLRDIDWVVVGGESGRGARPFFVEWARNILRQCKAQKVPFFMKQIGAKAEEGGKLITLKTPKGGTLAEFPEDLRVRERPGHYLRAA